MATDVKTKKCKESNKKFNPKEVARSIGKESMVYLLGYCSPQCYTKSINK